MITKELGKIDKIRFGRIGYQDAMFGISFMFSFKKSCMIGDDWCVWYPGIVEPSKFAEWTEQERGKSIEDIARRIAKLLIDAKVDDITKLAGVPVEITMEGQMLKSWRILTEVL